MARNSAIAMMALVLCAGTFTAVPASAQPSTGTARQTGISEHHRMMTDMMKEMSQEMSKMTEQMAGGEPTPEQRKRMSQRMESMSKLMHRMSGLESRPAMKGPEMQKEMEQMRKNMDEMRRESSMQSPAK